MTCSAHIFLTGISIRKIENFDLVKENDFVITTNLGPLHEFIAKRMNAFFLTTNGNIKYYKISEQILSIAMNNGSDSCSYHITKGVEKKIKKNFPGRRLIVRPEPIPFMNRKNIKLNTVYRLFNLTKDYETVCLWGADYALKNPLDGYFYNIKDFSRVDPIDPFLNKVYIKIIEDFGNKRIFHVCPVGNPSNYFKTINVE